MKDNKQIRIQFRIGSHVCQLELESKEARWQVDNLHEQHIVSPDKHARLIEHIDKIDENVEAATTVMCGTQEKLL